MFAKRSVGDGYNVALTQAHGIQALRELVNQYIPQLQHGKSFFFLFAGMIYVRLISCRHPIFHKLLYKIQF